jgi:addiction module HigA family antidote
MPTMNKMRPIHPGEVLREEFLLPLALSANALAIELKVPAPRISEIVRERRAITPDTALRLARYLGTTPEFWMDLQTAYDLKTTARTRADVIGQIIPYAA